MLRTTCDMTAGVKLDFHASDDIVSCPCQDRWQDRWLLQLDRGNASVGIANAHRQPATGCSTGL